MDKTNNILRWLLTTLVIWKVALLAVAAYAIQVIPFKASFPYWETLLAPNGHPLYWSWGNFDGVHYLTIAKAGYIAQFTQAFFPLFPLLMRYLAQLSGSLMSAGLIIAHGFWII